MQTPQPIPVGFQGEPGAFGEAALRAHFGDRADARAYPTFEAVFEAVATGEVERGVVPIENSLGGSILENYDLLLAHDLTIAGEVVLAVHHHLLAAPGTRLEDVTHACSHPQALAQCAPFLKRHGIRPCAATNTAAAARELSERPEPGAAAIASREAAARYGLAILAEDIQTRSDNRTRFFVLARAHPVELPSEKVSLVFTTTNRPGSLYASLAAFAARNLNLTKLESRPTGGTPWEYHFYVDFEAPESGPIAPEALRSLLKELAENLTSVRLLGAYPRFAAVPADAAAEPAS